jgi:hypothetical protein
LESVVAFEDEVGVGAGRFTLECMLRKGVVADLILGFVRRNAFGAICARVLIALGVAIVDEA